MTSGTARSSPADDPQSEAAAFELWRIHVPDFEISLDIVYVIFAVLLADRSRIGSVLKLFGAKSVVLALAGEMQYSPGFLGDPDIG